MIRRFWKSDEGNYAAIFAIAIIPIMAGVAGAVDYATTSSAASKLQESLDATALDIATKYHSGITQSEVQQIGSEFFGGNSARLDEIDDVSGFTASAVMTANVVDISASATVTRDGFIGGPTIWKAKRISFVRFSPGQPACVLALNEHASASVKVQGSTQVRLDGCVIASNSDATDSISRGGSALLTAQCVSTVGGTDGLSTSSTDLECAKPLVKQYASLDPLAGIVPPAYTACESMPGGKNKALTPGTYCNKTWSGTVTLDPGVYILRGGQVKLGGGGSLTGTGVTIFLMEGAEFGSNANEVIQLSPPTSGPYAGITIYQEYGNTLPVTINGGTGTLVTGFIYAPSAPVFYAGNSTMSGTGDCIRIIGDTVEMTGNSAVSSDCEAALGGQKMYAGRRILLVK